MHACSTLLFLLKDYDVGIVSHKFTGCWWRAGKWPIVLIVGWLIIEVDILESSLVCNSWRWELKVESSISFSACFE